MDFFLDLPSNEAATLTDAPVGKRKRLRVQAFPISDKPLTHKSGELRFDRSFAEQIVRNFASYAGKVPADYNHGTEGAAVSPEAGIASGWVTDLRIEGDAVIAYVDPTDRALSFVEAGEYRFASPTVHFDWVNPDTGKAQGPTLLSLALTNRPFIRGMRAVEIATFKDARASIPAGETSMETQPKTTQPPESPAMIALADHETAVKTLKDELVSLTDRAVKAETELASLKDELLTRDAKADVEAAERAGKVTPASRDQFLALRKSNLALFNDIVAVLPVAVKLDGPKGLDAPPAPTSLSDAEKGAKLTEAAEAIAKAENLSFRDALLKARDTNPDLASGF